MKLRALAAFSLLALAGCNSTPVAKTSVAPSVEAIDWKKVDESTARTKERKSRKAWTKTETRQEEQGYFPMTDDEYAAALENAAAEIRKENPRMSGTEVEARARARADDARTNQEKSYQTRASATVKWTSP